MLYGLLREQLPLAMLVSVGHRGTLDAFHTHRLSLDGAGGWAMAPVRARASVSCPCREGAQDAVSAGACVAGSR
jgi:ABC-type uncharacterized transport system fused permease/ATPase subunit